MAADTRTSGENARRPDALRRAFRYYLAVVALSVANAVIQLIFDIAQSNLIILGPVIEGAAYVGCGLALLAGKLWARVALLTFSGVFLAYNALFAIGLGIRLGETDADTLATVLLMLVAVKIVLILTGTRLMYRPENVRYLT